MLKNIIKIAIFLILSLFLLQAIIIDKSNPVVKNEPNWDSDKTKNTFMRACGDCHSNNTKWLWYSNIPPISFVVYSHVKNGRSAFNVSEFNIKDGKKASYLFERDAMPLWSYTLMHNEAILKGEDREKFIHGLEKTFGIYKDEQEKLKNEYNYEE